MVTQEEYDKLAEEFKEFQDSSREVEKEMEKELDRSEASAKALRTENEKLKQEVDRLKEKASQSSGMSGTAVSHLQTELDKLKQGLEQAQLEKRNLETENDSLENKERNAEAMARDLSEKLDAALEKVVMLQEDLDETRSTAEVNLQRLRQEMSDLKGELMVQQKKTEDQAAASKTRRASRRESAASGDVEGRNRSDTTMSEDTGSALNLVNDMIDRVKDLEGRLASCRESLHKILEPEDELPAESF